MRPAIIFYDNNGNPLFVGSGNTPRVRLLGHGSDGANASVLEVVGGALRLQSNDLSRYVRVAGANKSVLVAIKNSLRMTPLFLASI